MKFKFLLLLLMASNLVEAQQVVSLTDGKFVYRLILEKSATPHYPHYSHEAASGAGKKQSMHLGVTVGSVKSITIFPVNDTTKKQVIIPGKNESAWPWTDANKGEKFIIEDMNFDGNNDFRFQNSTDIYGYYCYVYKPSTGQFMPDSALSNLTGPQFDQTQKLIYENWETINNRGTKTFKYINGKLTLIQEEQTTDTKAGDSTIITLKKLVNGKMEVVKKTEMPRDH
jgi:hypothetical protein